jgi:hypothetical protein
MAQPVLGLVLRDVPLAVVLRLLLAVGVMQRGDELGDRPDLEVFLRRQLPARAGCTGPAYPA